MTHKELDELQALADAATPGPWDSVLSGPHAYPGYHDVVRNRGADLVGMIAHNHPGDARFIAAAREAVPRLIARIRELEKRDSVTIRQLEAVAELEAKFDKLTQVNRQITDAYNAQAEVIRMLRAQQF